VTAVTSDGGLIGGRAGRVGRAGSARQGQVVGRHERRPRPAQPDARHLRAVPSTSAGGAGWARLVEPIERLVRRTSQRWAGHGEPASTPTQVPGPRASRASRGATPRRRSSTATHPAGAAATGHFPQASTATSTYHLPPISAPTPTPLSQGPTHRPRGQGNPLPRTAGTNPARGEARPRHLAAEARRGKVGGWRLGWAELTAGAAVVLVAALYLQGWGQAGRGDGGVWPFRSPSQLVVVAAVAVAAGRRLRAAWSASTPAQVPGLGGFWPVVAWATLVVAMVAFFFQDTSPLLAGPPDGSGAGELIGLLAHNLLFVAAVLMLLRRWQTPLGTFAVLGGSVALLLATQAGFGSVGLVGAAVLGGAAADVAVSVLRPDPQRPWAVRAVAVLGPAAWWTAHFALLEVGYGVRLPLEIWLGSVVWASLSGFGLALLMWPPAVPLTAWNRGRRSAATPMAMPARMVGR
jgi:hypothetical protein